MRGWLRISAASGYRRPALLLLAVDCLAGEAFPWLSCSIVTFKDTAVLFFPPVVSTISFPPFFYLAHQLPVTTDGLKADSGFFIYGIFPTCTAHYGNIYSVNSPTAPCFCFLSLQFSVNGTLQKWIKIDHWKTRATVLWHPQYGTLLLLWKLCRLWFHSVCFNKWN